MNIEVIEAKQEDYSTVENLVRFYIYELSGIMGWDCPENGLFGGCDELPEYWRTQNPLTDANERWPEGDQGYPFLVRANSRLAGFALIHQFGNNPEVDYDVGQFFILRKYQRKGVGRFVAHHIFDKFCGNWEVLQMGDNKPAQKFWRKVISEYTSGDYEDSTEHHAEWGDMVIQRFNNSRLQRKGIK